MRVECGEELLASGGEVGGRSVSDGEVRNDDRELTSVGRVVGKLSDHGLCKSHEGSRRIRREIEGINELRNRAQMEVEGSKAR